MFESRVDRRRRGGLRVGKTRNATIAQTINTHAGKKKGMTNDVIEMLCKNAGGSHFGGVFTADSLPFHLASQPRFIIVVNLGRRRGAFAVGHFVTIAAVEPNKIYYLDSFGLPCWQPNVTRFLKACGRKIVWNMRQIQSFESKFCGMYASLFASCLDGSPPSFEMKFFRKKSMLMKNDALCSRYFLRILNQRL